MQIADAPATYALILANIIATLYAFYIDRGFINHFAFNVGAVVKKEQHYRIVTSGFLHADFIHIFFNMFTLFYFGPPVEEILGKLGFLVVYFGSMIAGGIAMAAVHRKNPSYSAVGASGAVSGVLLSACLFYPFSKIYIMFIPIGIPAILYGAFFIFFSARMSGAERAGVAHEGHLGGAIAGLVLTILMKPEAVTRFFS